MLKIWMLTLPLLWLHMSHIGIRALSIVLPSLEGTKFCRVITVDTAQLQAKQKVYFHSLNTKWIIIILFSFSLWIFSSYRSVFVHVSSSQTRLQMVHCMNLKKIFSTAYFPFSRAFLQHTCKCNYTHAHNKSMAATAPIFTKLPKGHQC